jgi:DNA-binding transcriptional regulator YhcF (GntR family)
VAQELASPRAYREDEAPALERQDEVPLGVQLAWRLRALIISGRIGVGEKLPGVRELAAGAGVNVNTARAIYRRLEGEGLAVSRHGLGTFVAEEVAARPALEHLAAEAAETARANGIDPRELARVIYAAGGEAGSQLQEPAGQPDSIDATEILEQPGDELSARRSLRAQIARLEAELAPYLEHLELKESPPPVSEPTGHVADIGELEATRDALVERLRQTRAAAEKQTDRQQSARTRLDEMVKDPAAHRWGVVSDDEIGEPGCKTYEVRPAWGPIGALMNWWRVHVSGGCPPAAPLAAAAG